MGLQAYDKATSARMMTEIQSLRTLMGDQKYGDSVLGAVIFRTGTVDYAKLTYDTQNKIIAVKVFNTGSNLQKIQVECKNGIKIMQAEAGNGISSSVRIGIASSGSTATISGSNILRGESGYIYLKYEGDITGGATPAQVRVYRSSEVCTYTVCYDAAHSNSDMGTPLSFEPKETESPVTTTATADTTTAAPVETTTVAEETTTALITTEPTQSAGCGATALPLAILGLIPTAAVLRKKKADLLK